MKKNSDSLHSNTNLQLCNMKPDFCPVSPKLDLERQETGDSGSSWRTSISYSQSKSNSNWSSKSSNGSDTTYSILSVSDCQSQSQSQTQTQSQFQTQMQTHMQREMQREIESEMQSKLELECQMKEEKQMEEMREIKLKNEERQEKGCSNSINSINSINLMIEYDRITFTLTLLTENDWSNLCHVSKKLRYNIVCLPMMHRWRMEYYVKCSNMIIDIQTKLPIFQNSEDKGQIVRQNLMWNLDHHTNFKSKLLEKLAILQRFQEWIKIESKKGVTMAGYQYTEFDCIETGIVQLSFKTKNTIIINHRTQLTYPIMQLPRPASNENCNGNNDCETETETESDSDSESELTLETLARMRYDGAYNGGGRRKVLDPVQLWNALRKNAIKHVVSMESDT